MFFPQCAVLAALPAAVLGAALLSAGQQPPPPAADPAGVQELARGPIHEAFAQPVVFDPQAGPVAPQMPPAPVNEVPPDEKPAGDDVGWIPGYWSWDDDQKQFVWVSGVWRKMPPGRVWVPGYWTPASGGAQWVSGYWAAADAGAADTQYLPEPPATLEAGPSSPAPSGDDLWVPGSWVWQNAQYAWQPGYWMPGSSDWVWMSPMYTWSPLGYTFVPGYWDYPLWGRGLPFAPVAFGAAVPPVFTPRLALNAAYLPYSLFVRPRFGSYYFGDYYAADRLKAGYYPWFSYHNTRYGTDPLFAHADWVYGRQNINWESRLREAYYARRDNPAERPARLYSEYARGAAGRGDAALVRPVGELRTSRDLPLKLERVDATRLKAAEQHAAAVRTFATERGRLEAERVRAGGPPAKAAVGLRLPEHPRPVTTVRAAPPNLPRPPAVDMARKAEVRPATPAERPHPLPHPEQVIRPEFDRRAAHAAPVQPRPPAPAARPEPPRPEPPRPAPPVPHPAPPAARPTPPPINGQPHPGHVPVPHPTPPAPKKK